MADALVGAGLGSLLGIGKYAGDVAGNSNDRKVDSVIAKFSPWTHQPLKTPRKANFLGDVLPAGISGAMMPGLMKSLGLGGTAAGAAGAEAGTDAGATLGDTGANSLVSGLSQGSPSLSSWAAIQKMLSGE